MGFNDVNGQYHAFREHIPLPLNGFREVSSAGAVGNIAANGGLLASDTTPILGAEATSEVLSLAWAAGNSDIIQQQRNVPANFDGRNPVEVELWVRTDNAGGGGIEAATFTILTSWDGGAQVTDTVTDSVPSETTHKITTWIDAADLPDSASFVNVQLLPGTHANDPVRLLAARLNFVPRTQS